ncbi:MAG: hypothetical protein WCF08_09045 [Anaerolineaceae bacterium]
MVTPDPLELLFILSAFLFQIVLIIHFALRKWAYKIAIKHGWLVYALSIPALVASLVISFGGKDWQFWLAGFLYFIWAVYGYQIEYIKMIEWRAPFRWTVGVPYLALYLATVMFYWFPLALIAKPLWYACGILFVISTLLNVSSHKKKEDG